MKNSAKKKILLSVRDIKAAADKETASAYIPSVVYRVQLNRDFNFKKAAGIVSYLKDFGADTIYCSPYFQAEPGSLHGYDVTDPGRLNTEIGSWEDYDLFTAALKSGGLSQLLDVVPNHMGISGSRNAWWMDVLENGQSSIYAHFFDIDWEPEKKELKDKVLLPILGDFYGTCLENQELKLEFYEGSFAVRYGGNFFPIMPDTYPLVLEAGLEELKKTCPEPNKDLEDYLTVIRAFRELPFFNESVWERKLKRHGEKEIAKTRLLALVKRSDKILKVIEDEVRLLNGAKGDPRSFDRLDALLSSQAYRVAHWRVASEEINYRRFFDINELAAIRIEDEDVFAKHHEFVFKLIQEGKVRGLRVDHPDGLYDPPEYFRRIQERVLFDKAIGPLKEQYSQSFKEPSLAAEFEEKLRQVLKRRALRDSRPLYVVAEKILDRKEELPGDWNVHGTVGYDYLNALTGLFVNREQKRTFTSIYRDFTGLKINVEELIYQKKKFFALIHMAGEINTLGHRLDGISEHDRIYRDLTRNNLTLAIREVIACFPVYRSYVSPRDTGVSERDEQYIHIAVEKAKRRTPALNPMVYDFLRNVLTLKLKWEDIPAQDAAFYRDFVLRFQQLTGPIMAKGFEDTAAYVHNRFIALNEVGGDLECFGISPPEFHKQNRARSKHWPASLITMSTHDTKRSEDIRMRLAVLSEFAQEWKTLLNRWTRANEKQKTLVNHELEPDRNTEYFIYQTLLGVWPNEEITNESRPCFIDRLWTYFLKALREAKTRTSWRHPDLAYEETVKNFVEGILNANEDNQFLKSFLPFQKKVSILGMRNTLSSNALMMGSPGVVDIYQGSELWNYCLVDPDNRRAVDFEARSGLLREISDAGSSGDGETLIREFGKNPSDGRLKLYLLSKGLNFRKSNPDLFVGADYIPLEVQGKRLKNIIAFMRRSGDRVLIVAAGRFFSELDLPGDDLTVNPEAWEDTAVLLPKDMRLGPLKNVFTGKEIASQSTGDHMTFAAKELFGNLNAVILAS